MSCDAAEKALRDAGFVEDNYGVWDKTGFSDDGAPLYNACRDEFSNGWELCVPEEELPALLRSLTDEEKEAIRLAREALDSIGSEGVQMALRHAVKHPSLLGLADNEVTHVDMAYADWESHKWIAVLDNLIKRLGGE